MNNSDDELMNIEPQPINFYAVIHNNLKKQYPTAGDKELNILTREAVFAPDGYMVEINKKELPIGYVRGNLANLIEREAADTNFIPYSLSAELANLIEQSSCETSSMNEYYRWVSATHDILSHTSDGEITHEDVIERQNFITMSYDREAEILLCLALYEGAGAEANREKINMLRFKLARLREMRIMVSNTTALAQHKHKEIHNKVSSYCQYCQKLLKELPTFTEFNLNLTLNSVHNDDEDLDDSYSHLENMRGVILYMMRFRELPQTQNEREEQRAEQHTVQNTLSVSEPQKAMPREMERC